MVQRLRSKLALSSSASTSSTSSPFSTSSAIPRALISRERIQNPETVDFDIIWLFEVCTCVFAMLKTVILEGGLYECSLNIKLIELEYW